MSTRPVISSCAQRPHYARRNVPSAMPNNPVAECGDYVGGPHHMVPPFRTPHPSLSNVNLQRLYFHFPSTPTYSFSSPHCIQVATSSCGGATSRRAKRVPRSCHFVHVDFDQGALCGQLVLAQELRYSELVVSPAPLSKFETLSHPVPQDSIWR